MSVHMVHVLLICKIAVGHLCLESHGWCVGRWKCNVVDLEVVLDGIRSSSGSGKVTVALGVGVKTERCGGRLPGVY